MSITTGYAVTNTKVYTWNNKPLFLIMITIVLLFQPLIALKAIVVQYEKHSSEENFTENFWVIGILFWDRKEDKRILITIKISEM